MASLKERLINRTNSYLNTETQKETERQLVVLEVSTQVWNELLGVFENLTDQELCGTVIISLRIESAAELSYTVTTEQSGMVHKIAIPHTCTVDDLKDALNEAFNLAKADNIDTRLVGYSWQFIYAPPTEEEEVTTMETSPNFSVTDGDFLQKLNDLKERYQGIDKIAMGIVNAVGYDDLEELKKQLKKVNADTKRDEKSEREKLSNAIGAYNAKRSGDLEAILQEVFALAESVAK